MRLVCPNNYEHNTFSVIAHVTQEWEVCNDGMYNRTLDECVDILVNPNIDDFIYSCTKCGETAITHGEIVELYATVTEDDTMPYIDIFDKEEDAQAEIGEISDDGEIVGYIKGYSFKPVGGQYLYDDAPDFCYTIKEAEEEAERLGIDLI